MHFKVRFNPAEGTFSRFYPKTPFREDQFSVGLIFISLFRGTPPPSCGHYGLNDMVAGARDDTLGSCRDLIKTSKHLKFLYIVLHYVNNSVIDITIEFYFTRIRVCGELDDRLGQSLFCFEVSLPFEIVLAVRKHGSTWYMPLISEEGRPLPTFSWSFYRPIRGKV